MIRFFVKAKIFFVLLLSGLFFVARPALALSVIDLRETATIDPGAEQIIVVDFFNDTDRIIQAETEVDSFIVDPVGGFPIFGQESQAELWVRPDINTVTLQPGETVPVPFVVRVPGSAEPGSHHLGLFLREKGGNGNVSVGTRVGSLFFLQVAGLQQELLQPQAFSGEQNIYFLKPIVLRTELFNKGTVAVKPSGTITITNMFGEIVGTMPFNSNDRRIFSGMILAEELVATNLDWKDVGPLTFSLLASYGVTNQTLSDTTVIWYVPWTYAVVALGFVLTILSISVVGKKLRKKRETMIKSKPNSFL